MPELPKRRGRPPKPLKPLIEAELLKPYPKKLDWCDVNGKPAADQITPIGYIRPLTKAKEQEAEIARLAEALAADPQSERCTSDGTPDANSTHSAANSFPL